MRPRHFARSYAICYHDSVEMLVFKCSVYVRGGGGGFEGVLVWLHLTNVGAFSDFSIENFLSQTFIRHSYHNYYCKVKIYISVYRNTSVVNMRIVIQKMHS